MAFLTKKKIALAIGLLVIAGAAGSYYSKSRTPVVEAPRFRTAAVDTGNITQTVTATGTINPVALINIGSQVSGTVSELKADFNDRVTKGQVLLKLDPTIFNAQIRQADAQLASAKASLRLAQATYQRNQSLLAQNYLSPLALDQSKREVDVAQANIQLAQAQLARAQADFDNSVIRSPIDGVIIKRTVDLGQTVAASFTTPQLFQIARDLTKMQIDTSVSEADVGSLKEGQEARFVVDAYPDKEFNARMRQFRLAANVVQNVVTYNVVLDVDNQDELLKPGMTAQVRLLVGNRQNVLRVPTAALRFRLSDEEIEKQKKAAAAAKAGSASASASAAAAAAAAESPADDDASFRTKADLSRTFRIYTLDAKNQPKATDVKIGLSNFRYTEVVGGELKKGDQVITRAIVSGQEGGL
ncbi:MULTISPECIES: efflux RND transporter periplasmic adaptor subunit [unclassified Duganella]|uniref:efflux RND transporter periplasmic adaptor subunit n=1 Tax=unclassified Duganella TaxID=2636909 RepID=UPI00088FE99E|nr:MULTISPECIES: efflux RND transporter periplasmic adaptor subunit [unclassified Duganella]SDG23124.1 HlyD family secretion protein [Duganella sp. OV458]SDJ25333.1 HlyD family secretion protein [Duganella sp. OV510]